MGGCHSQAIVGPRVPLSNESCIRLVRTENKSYQKVDAYFLGGYPPQESFRDRISEMEWKRLNIEFIEATKPVSMLHTIMKPKTDAVVAKVNRYILRPRGMFMKMLSYLHIDETYDNHDKRYYWYEIAITPSEVVRLEKRKSFVNVTVTEDNVKEDFNFKQRWPVPMVTFEVGESSLPIMNITIPNGVGPGQQITVQPPNREDSILSRIPPSSEWIFGEGRPYYQLQYQLPQQ